MNTYTVGGPGRLLLGLVLLIAALACLGIAGGLEFGIGWTAVVPAALLLMPALALLHRRRLITITHGLALEDGWLWRRRLDLPLTGREELELVPTAGLRAVVLHRANREAILATWLTTAESDRLATWLDAQHPDGRWPRREPRKPAGDR